MDDTALKPSTTRHRPTLSLTIPVVLALIVLGLAVRPRESRPPCPANPPLIWSGGVEELAAAIREAPRAVVYVGNPATVQGVRGLRFFREATKDIKADGITFFVIENESADDTLAWAKAFADERLDSFGPSGNGWVLWLEQGQLRDADPTAGARSGASSQEIVKHTSAVWP